MKSSFVCLLLLTLPLVILSQQQQQQHRRVLKVKGRARKVEPQPQQQQDVEGGCPEATGLQLYDDPNSCNHFFKCANGTMTYETCENGLLFDPATAKAGSAHNHCSYNWAVSCGDRPVDETAISSAGCEFQFGVFPIGDCLPKYHKCAHGVAVETPCDVGLVFDPRNRVCNWPDQQLELGCDPSKLLGGFTCPALKDLSPLAQRFLPFPRFPVEGQKGLFIICVDGLPRLQVCGAGAEFDEATLGCVEEF